MMTATQRQQTIEHLEARAEHHVPEVREAQEAYDRRVGQEAGR